MAGTTGGTSGAAAAEDPLMRRSMFNDPFGNLADYSLGIFYGGRMSFLHGGEDENHRLEPPTEFYTRKQALKARTHAATENLQQLTFDHPAERSTGATDESVSAAKLHKAKARFLSKTGRFKSAKRMNLVLDPDSEEGQNWSYVCQAGCWFWHNKRTREVQMESPFHGKPFELVDDGENRRRPRTVAAIPGAGGNRRRDRSGTPATAESKDGQKDDEESPQGTGALAYDRSEFEDFMKALDDAK